MRRRDTVCRLERPRPPFPMQPKSQSTLAAPTGLLNWFEICCKLRPITNSADLAAAGSILLISMCPTKLFDRGLCQKEQCPIMATILTIP